MQYISRNDQLRIGMQFESDYIQLMDDKRCYTSLENNFQSKAEQLLNEIKETAKPCYFEDDILQELYGISRSIESALNRL